jgi:hypothetical protein
MSDALRARIAVVRGRLRRVHLLAALCRCLLALVGLTAAFFILDWLALARLSDGGAGDVAARAVLLLAALGLFGWTVFRTVVAELRTRRSDDAIALRVERGHPALRGRLISTIQLTRARLDDDALVSRELIEVLEQETVGFAEALDFGSIIDRRTLKRVGAAALALLALALALGWWRRDYASALLARMSLARTGYPTAASIIRVTPGVLAAYGDPYTIEVELDPRRRVPEEATAAIRSASGDSAVTLTRVADAPAGHAIFRGQLPHALEDFAFRPAALDARWPTWEHVRVAQRPMVKELALTCTFPAYLGLPAETTAVGDLRVPVGTEVKLRAVFTKPIATATLAQRAADAKSEDRGAAMTLDAAHAVGETTFTVAANGSYAITLRDEDGLENGEPIVYGVAALPDLAPTVAILSPTQDKVVTRFAKRPIRFTVSDDHGIAKAWIRYVVGEGDAEGPAVAPKSVELTGVAQAGETKATREIVVDLSKYGVVEGQRMTWWIEVADTRQPEPNLGASRRYSFSVVDAATMTELLEQEKTKLVGELEGIHDRQKDTHDAVETVRSSVGASDSGGTNDHRAP